MTEWRTAKMSTPEGKAEMFAEMGEMFNQVNGGEALDADGFYKLSELYFPKSDEIAGGHFINDKATHDDVTNFSISIFGTDGKMTMAQWTTTFGPWMQHIKPHIKNLE